MKSAGLQQTFNADQFADDRMNFCAEVIIFGLAKDQIIQRDIGGFCNLNEQVDRRVPAAGFNARKMFSADAEAFGEGLLRISQIGTDSFDSCTDLRPAMKSQELNSRRVRLVVAHNGENDRSHLTADVTHGGHM